MRKSKYILLLLIVLIIPMAGCLGGEGGGGRNNIEYVEARGTWGAEGSVEVQVDSPDPVSVSETVSISIPEENITTLTVEIKVKDASGENEDGSTDPDEVSGSLDDTGGGYNKTLKTGNTPYSDTHTIKAQEDRSLPSQWVLTLDVVCNSGADTWPGPILILYTQDTGFSYNVTVSYIYLTPAET